jgi:hypothetical protein
MIFLVYVLSTSVSRCQPCWRRVRSAVTRVLPRFMFQLPYLSRISLTGMSIAFCVCSSVGMIVQDLVHLPGGPAFSESNPLAAVSAVPIEGWVQILIAISLFELATFKSVYTSAGGDLGFNPLNLKVDDKVRLQEVKNGRLGKWAPPVAFFECS